MAWIDISDPHARRLLSELGIDWNLKLPHAAQGLQVNGYRLMRLARRAGLGDMSVGNGQFHAVSRVSGGKVNSDGTITAAKIWTKQKTASGSIPKKQLTSYGERMMLPSATRSQIAVDIDTDSLLRRFPNGKKSYGRNWARGINRSLKNGILEASFHHNVVNPTTIPFYKSGNISAYAAGAISGLKVIFTGMHYVPLISDPSKITLVGVAVAVLSANGLSAVARAVNSSMSGETPKMSDFKFSLTPMLPIDRAVFAAIDRIFSRPLVRYRVPISVGR